MEFNVSTFFLEIINFLILIWILQRLFYKPLLEVIDKRKRYIDQSLADAKKLHQEAEDLRRLYENREMLWEQEKKAALSALNQQMESERSALMERLRVELDQERQKAQVTLTRQQQKFQEQAENQALHNGARFAGLLLQQTAGPELENRLSAMLIDHFEVLPEDCRQYLQSREQKKTVTIKVTSVYPLTTELKQQLEQRLGSLIPNPINFQYYQDATLIAGIRIDIGSWVLHANLKHELAGFIDIAYESE